MKDDAVPIPITGELDLHTFRPSELSPLLPAYFAECAAIGVWRVRVVHGKGTGALREGVHRLLEKLPGIQEYFLADSQSGGWGVTWVVLSPTHWKDR
jgi:DNA-nicking Smr family endonuclease